MKSQFENGSDTRQESQRLWKDKTANEILNDLDFIVKEMLDNAYKSFCVDSEESINAGFMLLLPGDFSNMENMEVSYE